MSSILLWNFLNGLCISFACFFLIIQVAPLSLNNFIKGFHTFWIFSPIMNYIGRLIIWKGNFNVILLLKHGNLKAIHVDLCLRVVMANHGRNWALKALWTSCLIYIRLHVLTAISIAYTRLNWPWKIVSCFSLYGDPCSQPLQPLWE